MITAGTVAEDYTYDGFDRTTEHRTPSATTRYAYDPFDRTVSRTEKAGTPNQKTTNLLYLGLDSEVIAEEAAATGQVKELYAYGGVGGAGQRLSKVKTKDEGTKQHSYYTYHPLGDVEAVTDQDGNTRDTYGYTAYGKDDSQQFTGADKPDPANPDKEQDNVYRFNAKRWDAAARERSTVTRQEPDPVSPSRGADEGVVHRPARDTQAGKLLPQGTGCLLVEEPGARKVVGKQARHIRRRAAGAGG